MTIDAIETPKALKHYCMRASRSKFVDSAEDASAFAERRAARDPRLIPILLRGAVSTHAPLRAEEAIRQAYERLALAAGEGKILVQAVTGVGVR
ncbi:MAG TPA: hypothetical protein VN603_12185 [Candidatus Acidoferrales bacterium]|nr:hypothetical protein [Candidatus Acidoferrales bacterium]